MLSLLCFWLRSSLALTSFHQPRRSVVSMKVSTSDPPMVTYAHDKVQNIGPLTTATFLGQYELEEREDRDSSDTLMELRANGELLLGQTTGKSSSSSFFDAKIKDRPFRYPFQEVLGPLGVHGRCSHHRDRARIRELRDRAVLRGRRRQLGQDPRGRRGQDQDRRRLDLPRRFPQPHSQPHRRNFGCRRLLRRSQNTRRSAPRRTKN